MLLQLLPLYGRAGRHCTQAAQHRRQAAQHLLTCLRPGLSRSPSAGAHWHRELSHRHPQRHGGPRAAAGKVVGLRPAGRIACSLLSHPYTCAPLHLPCLPSLLTGGAAFQPAVFFAVSTPFLPPQPGASTCPTAGAAAVQRAACCDRLIMLVTVLILVLNNCRSCCCPTCCAPPPAVLFAHPN